jgi:hypothetical protein
MEILYDAAMTLTGRPLLAAMCIGQVGNLLPHVVVPAVMAQYLIPEWNLSASEAGSSVIGNEAAIRFGRHRAIVAFMCIAGLVAALLGFTVSASPALLLGLLLVYSVVIPADSGALTSGMTTSADPAHGGPPWDCTRRSASGSRRLVAGRSESRSMQAAEWTRRPVGWLHSW